MECVLLILMFLFNDCFSYQPQTKIWIPNTNYNDSMNWLGHQLPCESNTVIFPIDLNAAIYLPSRVRVKEIYLSNNGELLLNSHGFVEITAMTDSAICSQKDVQFKKINVEPWLKPTNWKLKSKKDENKAVPHVERVPCIYDNVIFSKGFSFWVQYPESLVSVNTFNIEGQNLTNEQLQDFLLSEPGSRQFKNLDYQLRDDVISVKNIECRDKSGCRCQNNEDISTAVCHYSKHICNVTHCVNPVMPVGHCCYICGAYLLLKFDKKQFDLQRFISQVYQYLYISGYSLLDIHVSKILYESETHIQVVIVERDTYTGSSSDAATYLHNNIISVPSSYNIISSKLIISGEVYWPGQHLKTSIAIVLGSLFAVLMFLIIIYMIYGPAQEKKFMINLPFRFPNVNSFRPFLFARFENTGDTDVGLEFGTRSVASSLFNLDTAFDNPLFGEPEPSTSRKTSETEIKTENFAYKNPLYSDLKQQELSDNEE